MNLNDTVWVQLNEKGLAIFKEHWRGVPVKHVRVRVRGGWTPFQLWELMEIYGPHLCMSASLPFRSGTDLRTEDPCGS